MVLNIMLFLIVTGFLTTLVWNEFRNSKFMTQLKTRYNTGEITLEEFSNCQREQLIYCAIVSKSNAATSMLLVLSIMRYKFIN